MLYPENNEKNRFELATNVVDTWSLEDLQEYVIRTLESDYGDGVGCFEEDWDSFKDSFEWSEELCESIKKDCPNPGCHCGACGKKDNDKEDWQIKDALYGRR